MTGKKDNPLPNTQISAWRALWERLLSCRSEEMPQQKQALEKTNLNVADEAIEQSAAQKHDLHDGG
ncbi:MAG TPA: hypothetical protein VJ842_17240 [Pyrinomonadaceae bacterium]|nr:hypothetical protein [Pyrinomonadaceae bacterium]